MIRDLVLNDFYSQPMSSIYQFAKLAQRSEMLFDAVEVNCTVTVIIGYRLLCPARSFGILLAFIEVIDVIVPGRQPYGSDAEIFQIRKVVDHSLKISSVIVTSLGTVIQSARLRRIIVRRVT